MSSTSTVVVVKPALLRRDGASVGADMGISSMLLVLRDQTY